MMRVVFMGTPQLAASVLEGLADAFEVVGAYTRPDAVRGRGKALVASPVKSVALGRQIPVFTPPSLKDEEVQEEIRSLGPDVICVAAYGAILPREVLDIPRLGCINVHTSLLPRWRGAAPMQRAILAGDERTGVCIMKMEEGLDTGAYCKRVEVPVGELYLSELEDQLAAAGARALVEALGEIGRGAAQWVDQAEEGATYAAKIGKGELGLDCSDGAFEACAKVRASDAAHPARAVLAGRGATVERARRADDERARELCEGLSAGDLVFRSKRLLALCADGPIEVERLRPDGKKSMDARSFAGGIQGSKGSVLRWGSC